MNDRIKQRIEESIRAKQDLLAKCLPDIGKAVDLVVKAYRGGHKAAFFGNGGSAADAQHLAAELVGDYRKRRSPLPALAFHANTSTLTAVANDYGFEDVFVRHVEGLLVPGDVAVGLSTSGKSPNVLKALRAAKKKGVATIGLLGRDGGDIAREVDVSVVVPAQETDRIQECHILVGHIFCEAVEEALFP